MKNNIKEFKVKCAKCGKEFSVFENEFTFPKKEKYFCCRSCANTRKHTDEEKKHISEGLNNFYERTHKAKKYKIINKKYICGTKEQNEKHKYISCRQSPKWFNKLIPFGFDITTLWSEKIIEEYDRIKKILYNEYVINKLSPHDIYIKYNCEQYIKHSETLLHLFKDYGFPIRSLKSATVNAYLQGKLNQITLKNQYQSAWHTTWNGKEVYLRSSYEADYANELDKKQINYEVECFHIKYFDTQKQEYRCAIPDFYLPDTNTIVEIKSNYTLDVQNMKDKAEEYKKLGYNFSLILEHNESNINDL